MINAKNLRFTERTTGPSIYNGIHLKESNQEEN